MHVEWTCVDQIKTFCERNRLLPAWEKYFFNAIRVRPHEENHDLARVALMNGFQFSFLLEVGTTARWFFNCVANEQLEELEQQTMSPELAEEIYNEWKSQRTLTIRLSNLSKA